MKPAEKGLGGVESDPDLTHGWNQEVNVLKQLRKARSILLDVRPRQYSPHDRSDFVMDTQPRPALLHVAVMESHMDFIIAIRRPFRKEVMPVMFHTPLLFWYPVLVMCCQVGLNLESGRGGEGETAYLPTARWIGVWTNTTATALYHDPT